MLRSEAARYARWSAAVALLLAGITIVVYLERGREAWVQKRKAPPAAPVDVSRQSNAINFKKVDQNQTIFEVAASKSTEFKGQDASLLEDVKITIFGRTGDRHDIIHTQSCRYGKEDGGIICSGEVQIDLLSAEDAKRAAQDPAGAKSRATHIETRGVHFDRASGLAQTEERVAFSFPSGTGSALGLQYKSEEGMVRLLRDVRFTLDQRPSVKKKDAAASAATQAVHVKGASLDFGRDTRTMHLLGPAEAETPAERLIAGEITLSLDKDFHAEKLVARGANTTRPTVTSQDPRNQMQLQADSLTAHFSPEGSVTKIDASGTVRASQNGIAQQEEASADSGTLDLWPGLNQPKTMNLSGNVVLKTRAIKAGDSRTLQANALRVEFTDGKTGQYGKAQRAETLSAGAMEWTDATPSGGAATRTKLQADKLAVDFAAGQAKQLVATGNVQTERAVPGRPMQTATAHSGVAQLQSAGGWSQMDLDGDVKLKEGDRTGQGNHAVFVRVSQTAALTGNAVARDATTETHAPKITFAQATGEIHAEGGVRSTDLSARASAVQLAPAPVNVTSDTLQANSKAGRALYSGHARLWQGDSVLEAQSIELLRDNRTLNALGNVRAIFPQTPRAPGPKSADRTSTLAPALTPAPVNASRTTTPSRKPPLWHVTCGSLTYRDSENHARLEQDVIVQSFEQKIRAPQLDLYFTRAAPSAQGSPMGSSTPLGAQQISRAVGSRGVTIEEGNRKAVADRGEYLAAAGKFVMSGGNPTLYDGSAGSTTGRQLTFFLADDTIIVDSENGSRTVTKHRVEK